MKLPARSCSGRSRSTPVVRDPRRLERRTDPSRPTATPSSLWPAGWPRSVIWPARPSCAAQCRRPAWRGSDAGPWSPSGGQGRSAPGRQPAARRRRRARPPDAGDGRRALRFDSQNRKIKDSISRIRTPRTHFLKDSISRIRVSANESLKSNPRNSDLRKFFDRSAAGGIRRHRAAHWRPAAAGSSRPTELLERRTLRAAESP
ncbi:hypothetical protein ABIF62_003025 [Bradyrhizobium japonicum]